MDWKEIDRCYQEFSRGLAILPGTWRPFAPWEQVAWIHPQWSESGHLWLDFPEVLIVNEEYFAYAGHGPIGLEAVRHGALPASSWQTDERGLKFERNLPCGLTFGGRIIRGKKEGTVNMELYARNDGAAIVSGLKMQTCAYLRELNEFDVKTWENKYIHVPGRGWVCLREASKITEEKGKYRFGWRGGPAIADWPVMAVLSPENERLIAMTWGKDTYSLISNPHHPCIHADPSFPDLAPGQTHAIHGQLWFFEGTLADFSTKLNERLL